MIDDLLFAKLAAKAAKEQEGNVKESDGGCEVSGSRSLMSRSSSAGLVVERSRHYDVNASNFKVMVADEAGEATGEVVIRPTLDGSLFVQPCEPFAVSGGTARFFKVRLHADQVPICSPDQFIAKDIARAPDEVAFYLKLGQEERACPEVSDLAAMALEWLGVARLDCAIPGRKVAPRTLLILENLRCGFTQLRMCDIKIGKETALANWKGKSWLSASASAHVDEHSNSSLEGLRLEGMDCPPPSLTAKLSAATNTSSGSGWMRTRILGEKTTHKVLLQQLPMRDVLAFWLDLSDLGEGYERRSHGAIWSTIEKLTHLVRVLKNLPWPQMWIGTSLSLGLEAGASAGDSERVFVKLLDWGRAEFWDQQGWQSLEREERRDSIQRWQQFIVACCRLQWECTRLARHRCCCARWKSVVFEVCAEHLSVFHAMLSGTSEDDSRLEVSTVGLAMANVDDEGVLGSDCWLTVYSTDIAARSSGHSDVGTLCVRMQIDKEGNGATTLRLRLQRLDLDVDRGNDLITVRATAFEEADDALHYFEVQRGKRTLQMPRACACPQVTKPGSKVTSGYVWHGAIEFAAFGEAEASSARTRLKAVMPECFPEEEDATPSAELWKELPAYWCSHDAAVEHLTSWAKLLVPWLSLERACRSEWRIFPQPYTVGQKVQHFCESRESWIAATILETEMVAVRPLQQQQQQQEQPSEDAAEVQMELLLRLDEVQDANARGLDGSPFICVHDDCLFTASGGREAGRVLGVDLIVLEFEDEEGGRVSKHLPSSSDLVQEVQSVSMSSSSSEASDAKGDAEARRPLPRQHKGDAEVLQEE